MHRVQKLGAIVDPAQTTFRRSFLDFDWFHLSRHQTASFDFRADGPTRPTFKLIFFVA
jgi:hypothetical protein